MYTDSYLIPTRDCTYGSTVVREGSIIKSRSGCNPLGYTFMFKEKGQLIEFTQEPFTMEESMLNLAQQWTTKRIEVFNR